MVNGLRVTVRVNESDNRNLELVGFANGNVLTSDVHNDHGSGQPLHVGDSTKCTLKLIQLSAHAGELLLGHFLPAAVSQELLELLHVTNTAHDNPMVGEGATQPAITHEEHAGPLSSFPHGLLRLPLGTDEENGAAFGYRVTKECASFGELLHGLRQVENRDPVARAVDVRLHLRVPALGLVSKMDACLQQVSDCRFLHHAFLFRSANTLPDVIRWVARLRQPESAGTSHPRTRLRSTLWGAGIRQRTGKAQLATQPQGYANAHEKQRI